MLRIKLYKNCFIVDAYQTQAVQNIPNQEEQEIHS